MGLAVLLGVFALALAVGVPVSFALALAALAGFWWEGLPLAVAFQQMTAGMTVFSLLAIPFFILAGEIMLHGGIARRLIALASAAVGRVRGGLGIVNVLASMLFGGISGSAVADTSALGSILIPAMREKGYDVDYAVNVTVTSSIAGVLIPPSHNMILYALAAGGGVSVSALFLAGVLPGVLMCLCLAAVAWRIGVRRGYAGEPFPGLRTVARAAAQALPGLMTAVIILGGVLGGVFTVTESAAVGAAWAMFATTLMYRELDIGRFARAVASAVRTTAVVLLLVGSAAAFGYLLALHRVPERLATAMLATSADPILLLALINLALLALGTIMDMAALILICTPIFLPVARAIGVDPVQFGMVMMMNLGLGLTTPPVGSVLFVGCAIGRVRMEEVMGSIWPFWGAILVALMLVTYVPALSLALPRALLGAV